VIYIVMLAIFGIWGRKRLVLSPEEEYAISGGVHGDPQKEKLGGAIEAEILAGDDSKKS
jgi:ethanolamine permease